jgi:hypothetical protein
MTEMTAALGLRVIDEHDAVVRRIRRSDPSSAGGRLARQLCRWWRGDGWAAKERSERKKSEKRLEEHDARKRDRLRDFAA